MIDRACEGREVTRKEEKRKPLFPLLPPVLASGKKKHLGLKFIVDRMKGSGPGQ